MADTQIQLDEKIKNDRFNNLWKENFKTNRTNKEFDKQIRRGINFVKTKITNSKIQTSCYVVNPGPSLEKNITILKEIKKKLNPIIITSDVCLYRLLDEGIVPDCVCTIDPADSVKRFWEGYQEQTKKIILFAPTTCAPSAIQFWKGPIVFFNQRDKYKWRDDFFLKLTKYTKTYGAFLNLAFVGATLLQVASILNAREIFLVGWDFSSDEEGNMYCKGFMEKRIFTNITKEDLETDPRFKQEDHTEIKKELTEGNWDKGVELFKKKLAEELNDQAKKLKIKHKTKDVILWTGQHYLLYKNIFLKTIHANCRRAIFNCTEGGILTEIPCEALEDSVKYIGHRDVDLLKTLFPHYAGIM